MNLHTGSVRLVAAPDKFRGTATAAQVAEAMAAAAWEAGWEAAQAPLADGGEGLLDVLGGPNRSTKVTGPHGMPVSAEWRLDGRRAVIEMSRASGLVLAGGAEHNDPITADSSGTGELILAAIDAGARRVIVGLGGSACTDGGLGAVRAIGSPARIRGVDLLVAHDVEATFVQAADLFAPQKGATPAQVELLRRRLERLVDMYRSEFGTDVAELTGGGAAGGLGGGLAALGGQLISGFDLVADEVGLDDLIEGADLVVTGEGFVDEQSYEGKVVGGVVSLAELYRVPALVIAGQVFDGVEGRAATVSLAAEFGLERSFDEPLGCVRRALVAALEKHT